MSAGKKTSLRERFEAYYTLKKEIPLISNEIEDEKYGVEYAGSYQYSDGSKIQKEKPLFMASGSVKSVDTLLERKQHIIRELLYLENLVFKIQDSEIRQILTVAYFTGGRERRWERVAIHFERDITAESYRKKADRYLEKLECASAMSGVS